MLLSAIFVPISAQQQEIRCTFIAIESDYYCLLFQIEVTDPNVDVIIIGDHEANFSNDDVNAVQIQSSTTPFLIQEIFSTFRNLKSLYVLNSRLETISPIPDTVQLINFWIVGNNLTRIENNTFETQSELRDLEIMSSTVREVEENAFVGLESIEILALLDNQISELPERVFDPLVNAIAIDLRRNEIGRIQDELFAANSNLQVLLLDENRINAISPRFAESIRETVQSIKLTRNFCIDRGFEMDDSDVMWTFMTAALNECYNNFRGLGRDDPRENRLRFGSRLRISDGFGNFVFSTNENINSRK